MSELVDIRSVVVDKELPETERIVEYVRQLRDPRLFRCGSFTIMAVYPDIAPTLVDCLRATAK